MDDSHRPTHSTSSSVSLTETLLDDQDEDVRIAVRALGDMRNSGSKSSTLATPALSIASSSSAPTPSIPSPTLSSSEVAQLESTSEPDFVRRVSHIPLVNGALRMYEQSKASSRVVKYGAEIMESSVKTISRPVIERLPVNTVGQLDEFACRQLDRLQYGRPTSSPGPSPLSSNESGVGRFFDHRLDHDTKHPLHEERAEVPRSLDPNDRHERERSRIHSDDRRREDNMKVGSWLDATTPHMSQPHASSSRQSPTDSRSRSLTPTPATDAYHLTTAPANVYHEYAGPNPSRSVRRDYQNEDQQYRAEAESSSPPPQPDRQVAQRSRWNTVLSEFGGFAGALSEESMRKLRYCLHWLQYATNHIDAQILVLRDFTASLQQQYFDPSSPTTPTSNAHVSASSESKSQRSRAGSAKGSHSRTNSASEAISEAHLHKLTDIRRDVVHTVREVVNVVSKYGGGAALPEPAKNAMKGFILKLPQKWAEAVRMGAGGSAASGGVNLGGPGTSAAAADRESVNAAASGRAGSSRRTTARNRGRGERGVGSNSAAASPVSSRATSPSASPKVHPRGLHGGLAGDDGEARSMPTMSAGAAFVTAQRILVLATESLDMMRGVTGVVKDSLDRADAWVERLRTVGIQRGEVDGVTVYPRIGEGDLVSESSVREERTGRGEGRSRGGFTEYRDSRDPAGSPLMSVAGHSNSRRGSVGSTVPGEFSHSSPSGSPYISSRSSSSMPLPPVYASAPMDAPSPGVGLGLRRMSLAGEEGQGLGLAHGVKKEEETDQYDLRTPMDVDG